MKALAGILLTLALVAIPEVVKAATLETENFKIYITPRCAEGTVGCNNVAYQGTDKRTGKFLRLTGKQLMGMCADGKTPCRALGYEFKHGNYVYQVTEEGRFTIYQGKRVMADETGKWKY